MSRLLTLEHAQTERKTLHERGLTLALTNGCFDLLHVGHVRYLRAAAALADRLWVGVNSDVSVRLLKGNRRPLVPFTERAELMAALDMVDAVIPFDNVTAAHLLEALRPDVYVKGGDYTSETLPEAPLARALGTSLELIPAVPARSTSDLITGILQKYAGAPLD